MVVHTLNPFDQNDFALKMTFSNVLGGGQIFKNWNVVISECKYSEARPGFISWSLRGQLLHRIHCSCVICEKILKKDYPG